MTDAPLSIGIVPSHPGASAWTAQIKLRKTSVFTFKLANKVVVPLRL